VGGAESPSPESPAPPTPAKDLKDCALQWSTVDKKTHKKKKCLFCDHEFNGGPLPIRIHFDREFGTGVSLCKPTRDLARYNEVKVEMLRRHKAQVDKEKQAEHASGQRAAAVDPKQKTLPSYQTTVETCNEALVLAIGSTEIPLQIVDSPCFRKFLVQVAKCGTKFLDGNDDVKLAHGKQLTVDLIPKVDKELDERTRPPVMKVATSLGATMMSDGWKDVASRNFLNVLIVNPTGTWSVVHFITSHQKTLAIYRELKNEPGSDCKWELLGAGETRYASNILMLDRFSKAHNVIERDFQRIFNHFERGSGCGHALDRAVLDTGNLSLSQPGPLCKPGVGPPW